MWQLITIEETQWLVFFKQKQKMFYNTICFQIFRLRFTKRWITLFLCSMLIPFLNQNSKLKQTKHLYAFFLFDEAWPRFAEVRSDFIIFSSAFILLYY